MFSIFSLCDASQQKVPYVGQAYFEILSKITCKLHNYIYEHLRACPISLYGTLHTIVNSDQESLKSGNFLQHGMLFTSLTSLVPLAKCTQGCQVLLVVS